jgi:hypothetical protein
MDVVLRAREWHGRRHGPPLPQRRRRATLGADCGGQRRGAPGGLRRGLPRFPLVSGNGKVLWLVDVADGLQVSTDGGRDWTPVARRTEGADSPITAMGATQAWLPAPVGQAPGQPTEAPKSRPMP